MAPWEVQKLGTAHCRQIRSGNAGQLPALQLRPAANVGIMVVCLSFTSKSIRIVVDREG